MSELPRNSVRRLHLAPLSEAAVAHLAQETGRSAAGLHAITGGNPFFVTEVLAAEADATGVPATARDAVLARVRRLGPAARAMAELAAIVPGKTEWPLLEQGD